MHRASIHRPLGQWPKEKSAGALTLDFDARHRRRIHLTTDEGEELCATFTGQLDGVTGAISATVTYVGGTGRFTDATGTATLTGQLLGGGAVEVSVNGFIDY